MVNMNLVQISTNFFHGDFNQPLAQAGYYRFSLSWPRLLPSGAADEVNEDGVRYYNAVIDECLANGVQPVVSMEWHGEEGGLVARACNARIPTPSWKNRVSLPVG